MSEKNRRRVAAFCNAEIERHVQRFLRRPAEFPESPTETQVLRLRVEQLKAENERLRLRVSEMRPGFVAERIGHEAAMFKWRVKKGYFKAARNSDGAEYLDYFLGKAGWAA